MVQLRSYASAITNDERFDQLNSSWEFWLIGNETSDAVDEQRTQQHLPLGVVQNSAKCRIIVRTWLRSSATLNIDLNSSKNPAVRIGSRFRFGQYAHQICRLFARRSLMTVSSASDETITDLEG